MMIVYFTLIPSALQPFTQMSLYIADRQFYIIDVAANLYSPLAYYMAQTITSIPFTVITAQVRPQSPLMYPSLCCHHSPRAKTITE